jgi:hypothetical protein
MENTTISASTKLVSQHKSNKPYSPELQRIINSRIHDKTVIRRPKPVVMVGGSIYARQGDFSVITGQRKAGKTTVLQFVVATGLLEDVSPHADTLQIRSEYCKGKDVIYVDTEGSHEDTQDFINGVKKIMGVDNQPENFYAYHWREFTQSECRKNMDLLFMLHPNAHLWIIDGIADLVSKPNDEEESNSTVRWIMSAAGRLDTCFIVVIHENAVKAGQEAKLRGHLGSELERKASGAIGVEKDKPNNQHFIKSRFLRKSADFDPVAFRFDKELGRPVSRALSVDELQQLQSKDYARTKELAMLRDRCFLNVTSKTEKELRYSVDLYQATSPSKDAARVKVSRNIKAMLETNLIREEKTPDGMVYYPISQKGESIVFERS